MYLNQDFGFYHRLGYKGGIHIRVWNLKDDTLIFDKTIWMFKKYLPIRLNTHSVPHECPRIWCIGDSHIWHNFGGINNVSILKYQLIKYSMPSLTMHRFSSRNWKDFLEFLPIEPQDILLFNFGECDLRYNFKLYSEKSGVNVKSVIYDSCQKYFAVLKQIEKIYADNKIYLMTPNFPISNDLEKETDYFAPYTGDEIIRKEMDDFFRCLIKTQPFFKVYDCPQQYADVNGYMNKENLNPKDIHISNFQYFLDGLLIFLKANGHT
jgi:hypothetical protein